MNGKHWNSGAILAIALLLGLVGCEPVGGGPDIISLSCDGDTFTIDGISYVETDSGGLVCDAEIYARYKSGGTGGVSINFASYVAADGLSAGITPLSTPPQPIFMLNIDLWGAISPLPDEYAVTGNMISGEASVLYGDLWDLCVGNGGTFVLETFGEVGGRITGTFGGLTTAGIDCPVAAMSGSFDVVREPE